MSIINEALKKAGREKARSDGYKLDVGLEDSRRNLEQERRRRGDGANWGPLFILVVLALISGPIVAPMVVQWTKPAVMAPSVTVREIAQAPGQDRKAQFAVEEAPLFAPAKPMPTFRAEPGFVVSGLVVSPTGSFGIINDQVVRTGEMVDGAKVVEITKNKAVLDVNGQTKEIELNS